MYGMYTTPSAYAPQVPRPGNGFEGATYTYVALIDPNAAAPAACISPNSVLSLPPTAVGTSQQATVTIKSCGTEPLTITGAATGSAVFTVPQMGDACTQALPVGQSCTLVVVYTPTGAETDSSTLTVSSNASIPTAVITISGTGTASGGAVSLSPASVSFAPQPAGTTSPAQIVSLSNKGGTAVILSALGITNSTASAVAESSTCGSTLAAGASCNISLTFTPPAAGTYSGTLLVTDSADGSPQLLSVTGSAPQPLFSIGPANNGSNSSTVVPGQPAAYTVLLTPASGYSGTVKFTCTGLPVDASCSFNPSGLALSDGQAQATTVVVATATANVAWNRLEQLPLLAALIVMPWTKRRRRLALWRSSIVAVVFLSSLCLVACGGGSSSTSTSNKVAAGTYAIQAVASDGVNHQSQALTLIVQ